MSIKTAILTISTRGARGEREQDLSGEAVKKIISKLDCEIIEYKVIRDDKAQIVWHLKRLAEAVKADLVLTTGGTGLSPTDVTPDATLEVIDRRIPGLEEAMRTTGFTKTPYALLSRAVTGSYEKTLIINLPGSPTGVEENLSVIVDVLPHAVKVLRGVQVDDTEHKF